MATDSIDPKALIDPTESIASAQQKLDLWTRRGTPKRVIAVTDASYTVTSWDLSSATPAASALVEVIFSETANEDIVLPAVAENYGREIKIKNVGSADLTITPDGSETIDGASTLVLSEDEFATLIAARTVAAADVWYIV